MGRRIGANQRSARQRRGRVRARQSRNVLRAMGVCVLTLGVGAACSVALRVASARLRSSDKLRLHGVEVVGTRTIATEDIIKAAGLQPGASLLEIKPSRIREVVERLPMVERATVRWVLPGRVRVSVVEREPVAIVNMGRVFLVDAEGVLFDLDRRPIATMPVISGLRDTVISAGERRLTAASQRRLEEFRSALKRCEESDWWEHISQAEFTGHGVIRLSLVGYGAVIEIDEQKVTDCMNQLRRLLEVLAEEGSTGPVRMIKLFRTNVAYVSRG